MAAFRSEETLDFYLASDPVPTGAAATLYGKHIASTADAQINIDASIRSAFERVYQQPSDARDWAQADWVRAHTECHKLVMQQYNASISKFPELVSRIRLALR
ncbi:regulator of G-protein signaling domain-containing protein [Aporhodopirellula aestuarii]|uniref:Uncharacterized protein n=1 Tax=Aporhodopirellula aestuarii TaxID=2950107 RepID=A0ABT0TZB5_9BACT|nr:hypothetical protein [Aporhodopirellula aestuarii]MCM2369905.1 hypothetical protein [Aporhodopirellula aestuarii]